MLRKQVDARDPPKKPPGTDSLGLVPQRIRASPSYARRIAARAIASSLARCSGGDGHRVDQRKGRSDGRGQPRAGSSQAVKETKQGGCCSSGSVFTEQVGTESVGKKTRKQLPTISGAAILWLETLDQTNKHATITNKVTTKGIATSCEQETPQPLTSSVCILVRQRTIPPSRDR